MARGKQVRFRNSSKYLDWSKYSWTPNTEETYVSFYVQENKFIYGTQEYMESTLGDSYDLVENELLDSNSTKYLLRINPSIYHTLHDTLPVILQIHNSDPDGVFVIFKFHDHLEPDIYSYVEEFLSYKGIKHAMINPVRLFMGRPLLYTSTIKISNYIDVEEFGLENNLELSLDDHLTISNEIRKHVGVDNVEPHRKVYLSRSHLVNQIYNNIEGSVDNRSGYTDDIRMNRQHILEEFFASRGYEIIIPEEKFSTFKEQIEYMASVKILVSVTSSGLTNSLLMKEKQIIIEIPTELVHHRGDAVYSQSLIHDYMQDSYIKKHIYVAIPSRREPEEVLSILESWESVIEL